MIFMRILLLYSSLKTYPCSILRWKNPFQGWRIGRIYSWSIVNSLELESEIYFTQSYFWLTKIYNKRRADTFEMHFPFYNFHGLTSERCRWNCGNYCSNDEPFAEYFILYNESNDDFQCSIRGGFSRGNVEQLEEDRREMFWIGPSQSTRRCFAILSCWTSQLHFQHLINNDSLQNITCFFISRIRPEKLHPEINRRNGI